MNGYLQRMIARGKGTASLVRPLTSFAYVAVSPEKSPISSNDLPIESAHSEWVTKGVGRADGFSMSQSTSTEKENAAATGVINALTPVGSFEPRTLAQHTSQSPLPDVEKPSGKTRRSAEDDGNHKTASQPISKIDTQQETGLKQDSTTAHAEASLEQTIADTSAEILHFTPLQSLLISPQPNLSPQHNSMHESMQMVSSRLETSYQIANSESRTIQVTIGRVEIRATPSSAVVRKGSTRTPAMSLEEYLKQRNGGGR